MDRGNAVQRAALIPSDAMDRRYTLYKSSTDLPN